MYILMTNTLCHVIGSHHSDSRLKIYNINFEREKYYSGYIGLQLTQITPEKYITK